jgi:hypothetical protein
MLRMCVYMHSRFVKNHPILILKDGPLISEMVMSHGSPTGLAPVCGCGSGFTPMGAPAPNPGWQRAWVQVSIRTCGSPLGARLHPMYYNFGSQNPRAPATHGHLMADTLSKPTGTRNPPGAGVGAVFHPRMRVRVFIRQHLGAGRVFNQPAPNPPSCHPYSVVRRLHIVAGWKCATPPTATEEE